MEFFPDPSGHHQLAILFFLQLALILLVCRAVGLLARRVGQPQVMGEMIAGVLLGPSLLGAVAPGVYTTLFPPESKRVIYAVAQVGLALYMFLVGVEFDLDLIRKRVRGAAAVSLVGMVVPFTLGAVLATFLAEDRGLFPDESTRLVQAMLFMGSAMAITAFPMLARILHESGMAGSPVGVLALAAGAVDDAAAWCLFAVVLATFSDDATIAVAAIVGGVLYAAVCLLVVRPMLRGLGRAVERRGEMSSATLALVLAMLMAASWFTDAIGIYSVFGAFILGVCMPRGAFAKELRSRIGPLTTALLVPLFFVYSGLNTKLGLVNTAELWGLTVIVLVAACVGKGVACWAAARLAGETEREARGVGALMNARGMMELILLNIGYERGIISQSLFSIMVVMALVTTLMATPVFERVYAARERRERKGESRGTTDEGGEML
ncbi:MAG: cation:proton antiporter [Phycisphaerales bacterium]|nr:cation:proton antiporter [Phycisphaerales bacterium]